jgi:hypothetical protein
MVMTIIFRTKLRELKLPKYGNRKVVADGIRFDSEKEWRRYTELQLALKSGLIAQLEVHPAFDIVVNGEKVCTYVGDFAYRIYRDTVKDGETLTWDGDRFFLRVVEDTKGYRTRDYILKKKLMKAVHKIEVKEI